MRYLFGWLLVAAMAMAEVPLGKEIQSGVLYVRLDRYSTAKATEPMKRSLNLTDADVYAKTPVRGEGVVLTLRTSEAALKELIVEVTVSRNGERSSFVQNCSPGLYANMPGPQCFIQTGTFDRVESVVGYPVILSRSPVHF